MVKRICACTAVFLLTLYCFFLYDDAIVAAMLAAELLYFSGAFITLRMMRKSLHISLEPILPIAEKNQEIPVWISSKNTSWIPVIHYQVQLRIENAFTGEKEVCRMTGTAKRNESDTLCMTLRGKSCGNIRITLERCRIYDFLFLLQTSQKRKETQQVGILPECRLLPVEVTRRTREFLADAEEFSDRESGDDPSEIYQIREYREKDSIHDIHWKLSAKADELLVKEHGRPLGCVVLIWLNLESEKGPAIPLTNLLEAAASLSLSLLEAKCVHMVAWYEPENRTVQKKRISKEEHIYELLTRLLFVKPHHDGEHAQSQYEEAFRGEAFSTIVEFRMDGLVLVNAEEHTKIPQDQDSIKWDAFFFTV